MSNNGNGNRDYIPEDVSSQILEDLWKFYFKQGCLSMAEAYKDWWGKPPSVWPDEIRRDILYKGALDLIADTRHSISEIQDIAIRIDREIRELKKQMDRSDVLKEQIEVDERRNGNGKTES